MMYKYGLDTFCANDIDALNNTLISLIVKHYPEQERYQLGAMVLADTTDGLAQKVDALEDGRSNGFHIHPGMETDILNALFSSGMARNVRIVDGRLCRAD